MNIEYVHASKYGNGATVAEAFPGPAIVPALKVAVAVPPLWIVACAPEMVPSVPPKLTGVPAIAIDTPVSEQLIVE